MANRIISATVTGESIKLSNKIAGAAGSHNAVSLSITFDGAWDDTLKKLYFFDAFGENAIYILLISEMIDDGAYVVPIPSEPLAHVGEMTLTIRGVEMDGDTAERIMMSASTTMKVLNAEIPASDVAPIEPTPTQAEQLLNSVNSVTGMTVSASTLIPGSSATVTKTCNANGTINLGFGIPEGTESGSGYQNVVINGDININQRGVSGTVTLAAGAYGHDMWKAGASGCSYTFAPIGGITTITILSGSLVQIIEGASLETDTYCLSWSGTAQGKIGAGEYGASGIAGSATGGANLSIEFSTGTLTKVKLEQGAIVTPYRKMPSVDQLKLCQRIYYRRNLSQYETVGLISVVAEYCSLFLSLPVEMRLLNPTITFSSGLQLYDVTTGASIGTYNSATAKGTGAIISFSGTFTTHVTYAYCNNAGGGYIEFISDLI